jgi:hypothetical protein
MRSRSGEQVPSLTAQIARVGNPGGKTVMWARDRLDGLWNDEDFADRYPCDGRPGRGHCRAICMRISLGASTIRSPDMSTVTLCRVPVNRNGAW